MCMHNNNTSQMQVASLEESEKQSQMKICSLQQNVQEKELEIKALLQQIVEKEDQKKEQISVELVDMKINRIQLQNELDQLHTILKFSQEEASCYRERATSVLPATRRPIKVEVGNLSYTHAH